MPWGDPSYEGLLPQSGPFNMFNNVDVHPGRHNACLVERADDSGADSLDGCSWYEAREEDSESGRLLNDLPPRTPGFIEYVMEHDRMDIYIACLVWQVQDVFDAPFDVFQKGEGAPAGAAPAAQPHCV